MSHAKYWPDSYLQKKKTASEAMSCIRSGQRIFVGSSCGEPKHLVEALIAAGENLADIEILRLMSLEDSPLTRLTANGKESDIFHIRHIYQGSGAAKHLLPHRPFLTPINLSAVCRLLARKTLPIHVAMVQVSPPDDFGWMSLGVSVDIAPAAVTAAETVIAQVNPRMPRVWGQGFIHVNDIDIIVEHEEDITTIHDLPESGAAHKIASLVANLVKDGATFQLGLGATPDAILLALSDKNDLGVHTQFLVDGIMKLIALGVITNRYKGTDIGKTVASNAAGSKNLYEFIADNPAVAFFPSDYVNNPAVISQHPGMISVNMVMEMDLTGQASADVLPGHYSAGVSSMLEFIRGADASRNGKSILLVPSTSPDGKTSRIVSSIETGAVVVPRSDVSFVVSEFGAVNLFGKSLQERARAMISLAHPDFRDELFDKARESGLIPRTRKAAPSLGSVYPSHLEEIRHIDGTAVTFRPAKPIDDRRIQEHFYTLDKEDVIARFFHEKTCFLKEDVACMVETDYVNDLTILAVTGEFGFGRVIGIAAYMKEENGWAETAFSVSKPWQGKGIGKILMMKLYEAARECGIKGFHAYTDPTNRAMIKLFFCLPGLVESRRDADILVLSCSFEPPENMTKNNEIV